MTQTGLRAEALVTGRPPMRLHHNAYVTNDLAPAGPRRQTACGEAWSPPASPRCGHASKRRAGHPLPGTAFEPKSQENLILRVIVPYVTGRIP